MIALTPTHVLTLTREETLLLIESLAASPSGAADALLWRLSQMYHSFAEEARAPERSGREAIAFQIAIEA